MAPLILTGLSLLPKIPEIWNSVAGLFGKKVPESVEAASKLASEVMGSLTKGSVSEEAMSSLQAMMNEHEETIMKLELEEKKLHFQNMANHVDLEKESYKSDDEYVRRTRPMILRRLFYACVAYSLFTPYCLLMTISLGGHQVSPDVLGILQSIGSYMWGTFTAGYLGYSTARSVDKKNPEFKNGNGLLNKAVKLGMR